MNQEERGKRLKQIVDRELEDYSYFDNRTLEFEHEYNGHDYYLLTITVNDDHNKIRSTRFKVCDDPDDKEDVLVEICLGEDSWHKMEWWASSVKYLWQAILIW